jgi:transcriptional regulator NrdR family protein
MGEMQLKVIKTDGTMEDYLHTKVLGTISNALGGCDQEGAFVAEQLADAITFYLYNKHTDGTVSTSEIYYMIQAMLTSTGYEQASLMLNNYHFTREITRKRIEVIYSDGTLNPWNKSFISTALETSGLDHQFARAIASMVEEKILRIGLSKVPASLIRQLVEIETQAMLQAKAGLESIPARKQQAASRIAMAG